MKYGQPLYGVEQGPAALRDAGLHAICTNLGWEVSDLGDLSFGETEGTPASNTAVEEVRAVCPATPSVC